MWDQPIPRAILAGTVALVLMAWKGPSVLAAARAGSSASTAGIVTEGAEAVSSISGQRARRHRVALRYEYHVDGRTYEGDRIGLLGGTYATRDQAAQAAAAYPLGRSITVHYDPRSPSRACLVPPASLLSSGAPIWIGAIAVCLGIAGWYTSLHVREQLATRDR